MGNILDRLLSVSSCCSLLFGAQGLVLLGYCLRIRGLFATLEKAGRLCLTAHGRVPHSPTDSTQPSGSVNRGGIVVQEDSRLGGKVMRRLAVPRRSVSRGCV